MTLGSEPDLRLGRWQDVLRDEYCDALIADPPYSARTAAGYRTGSNGEDDSGIAYGYITKDDAHELADHWAPRVRRWAVVFCDHVAWPWHEAAWRAHGWTTFAPIIWVKRGCTPRFQGDGPASQVDHILIARPKSLPRDGSRPGWYMADTPRAGHGATGITGITGNKDVNAMRALVRDYTRVGDVVIDPYAGSGTTARACRLERRRCITAEADPGRYEIARRLLQGFTPEFSWCER